MNNDIEATHRRAREVLKKIKEGTERLRGEAVPALPAAAARVLEAAAAGKTVDAAQLARALAAAEGLGSQLVWTFLKRPLRLSS